MCHTNIAWIRNSFLFADLNKLLCLFNNTWGYKIQNFIIYQQWFNMQSFLGASCSNCSLWMVNNEMFIA